MVLYPFKELYKETQSEAYQIKTGKSIRENRPKGVFYVLRVQKDDTELIYSGYLQYQSESSEELL